MGPHGGPIFGPANLAPGKATAYFQWLNAAMDEAPPLRPPLIVNMDETAIVRHVTGVRGTIIRATRKFPTAIDRVSLSNRRSSVSLLASVASDATVQAQLPQVLLGNEHAFTLQVLRSIGSTVGNVTLWRQKSAWNSHSTMRKWLTLLAKALGPLVEARYVIVVVDVHPSHIDTSIFLHARRCGVRLVYIPAKLTSFLQPCDTHVFASFKQAVRRAWVEEKSKREKGAICTEIWLKVVCSAIQKVLVETTWRNAFLADGVLDGQRSMSSRLAQALGFDTSVEVPRVLPTLEEASCIFPSRVTVDIAGYLTWETQVERKKRKEALEPPSSAPTYKGRVIRTLN